MKIVVKVDVEEITVAHNGPTEVELTGLIYTRAAAHNMLDSALDIAGLPEDK